MNELLNEASSLFKAKLRGILALLVVGVWAWIAICGNDAEGAKMIAVMALSFYFGSRTGNGDTR